MNRRQARVSVRAVIVHNDRVLLALHEHPERASQSREHAVFWCFPGGSVEQGEDLAEAVCRELREEAALVVKPLDIVYIQDFVGRDMVDIFIACELLAGELELGSDPEPGANHLKDVRWIPLPELEHVTVLPRALAQRLAGGLPLPAIPFSVI